jgi:hypothetical protein
MAFCGRTKTERWKIRTGVREYLTRKADIYIYEFVRVVANVVAFLGRSKIERRRIRREAFLWLLPDAAPGMKVPQPYDFQKFSAVSSAIQDMNFPLPVMQAERLIVIAVPEHNAMSGGIYSMFSIASHLRRIRRIHGYEVVVMTRPQKAGLTYFRNTNFINSENVFRFSKLGICDNIKELYLHIPEYTAATFLDDMSGYERAALERVETLRINILNQNVKLMPEPELLDGLRTLTSDITQSVAHHAYFSQDETDRYNLPTLLLPAYTDLSAYPAAPFPEKEKLIIYSPDAAPHKVRCLSKIRETLPDFELVEICDITFDNFMDLATRCMFSITFGEGFDGYLAQPMHQGGIGFATYEKKFFPSDHFKAYYNIFADPEQMVEEICGRIRYLESNRNAYEALNRRWIAEYEKLYNYDEYRERIRMLAMREFELFPRSLKISNSLSRL